MDLQDVSETTAQHSTTAISAVQSRIPGGRGSDMNEAASPDRGLEEDHTEHGLAIDTYRESEDLPDFKGDSSGKTSFANCGQLYPPRQLAAIGDNC